MPEGGCLATPNALDCDDGLPCTTAATCSDGVCVGVEDPCDDGNLCTADSCNPATGCTHAFDPSVCDDGNPCTSYGCLPEGGCVNTPNAADCDDQDPCTPGDSCSGGVWQPWSPANGSQDVEIQLEAGDNAQ